jgi:hypothetical protein
MNEAGELFVRLQAKPIQDVAVQSPEVPKA